MKKLIIFILLAAVVAVGAMKLMKEKQAVATQATALPLNYTVNTTEAKKEEVSQKRHFLATLKSDKEIKVMTKLSGTITKLYVSESDEVKKGDRLVAIDDSVIKTNLKTLHKTLDVQKSDVAYYESVQKRNEKLYNAKAISKEKYDASTLQLLAKKAAVDATLDKISALESDMKYLKVRAPFSGVVAHIYLHRGDLASIQKPILSLSENNQKMTFTYAATKDNIAINDKVVIGGKIAGYVAKIYPNAQNSLNVAEVKLEKRLNFRNESSVSIEVITSKAAGCSVPLNTIVHTKEGEYVVAFDGNKFQRHNVDILLEDDHKAIIKPCVSGKIAQGSESKLSILPFYKNITIAGGSDEK